MKIIIILMTLLVMMILVKMISDGKVQSLIDLQEFAASRFAQKILLENVDGDDGDDEEEGYG